MKLTAVREDILAPLQSVIGVVERRQTMPVLANVLLAAHDGKLSVTGTDLEVELVAASAVTVQQPGDITVPGRKLLDIFRSLPEKTSVSLTTEGERVSLRAGRSRFTLSSLPAAEFPLVEEINAQQTLSVAQGEFRRLDRQDALLDGAAGCAVLPEWTAARNRRQGTARSRHRRSPACAVRDGALRQSEGHTPGHRASQGCARAATHSREPRGKSSSPSELITFVPRSAKFASLRS